MARSAWRPARKTQAMTAHTSASADFWDPTFEYEHRDDGTVIIRQQGDLQDHLPLLADYLDKWADATPDTTWVARRGDGGDWRHITYAQGRTQAKALGADPIGVFVPHPIQDRTDDEVRAIADDAVERIVAGLVADSIA